MPDILETAEIKYGINGLLSLTPDAMPLVGETVEVKNLWSAAAIWIKEGPGTGKLIAEWMTHGYPDSTRTSRTSPASTRTNDRDPHHRPLRRALQQDLRHRASPEQWDSSRNQSGQPAPSPNRARSGRCTSRPAAGSDPIGTSPTRRWSRPTRIEATATSRMGSPAGGHRIQNAEHLALREQRRHGRPHRIRHLRLHRPGSRRLHPDSMAVNQMRRAGRVGPSTRRCSTSRAASGQTSPSCASATPTTES